jgi:hypothetical protein
MKERFQNSYRPVLVRHPGRLLYGDIHVESIWIVVFFSSICRWVGQNFHGLKHTATVSYPVLACSLFMNCPSVPFGVFRMTLMEVKCFLTVNISSGENVRHLQPVSYCNVWGNSWRNTQASRSYNHLLYIAETCGSMLTLKPSGNCRYHILWY